MNEINYAIQIKELSMDGSSLYGVTYEYSGEFNNITKRVLKTITFESPIEVVLESLTANDVVDYMLPYMDTVTLQKDIASLFLEDVIVYESTPSSE